MLKSHMMKNIVLACCFLDINFYETCPGTDKTCQGLNFLNSGTGIRSLQFLATHVTSYVSRISCLTARLQENVDYTSLAFKQYSPSTFKPCLLLSINTHIL